MGTNSASIESIGHPLAFPVEPGGLNLEALPPEDSAMRVRTMARALAGMQKEAIIQNGPAGNVWRVVCDEGPWLNGTDLAPFPLAFFAAGLAASLMSEILGEAGDRGVGIDSLNLVQDNFFTMEGSALRGTMAAGVQPMQVNISLQGDAAAAEFEDIAETALRDRCPAVHCLHESLASGFAIRANDEELPWPGEAATNVAELADPAGLFDRIRPASIGDTAIIRKSGGAAKENVDAVGLKAEQKRIVHVHSEGTLRDDGLKSIKVQCIQPQGSCFQMLSDDSRASGGQERAPDGLVYLAAGVAFCFMTQIGRYAQITRQKLNGYQIIQDTARRLLRNDNPGPLAVETLVCLDTDELPEKSIKLVQMGQQTCYVHAAFRSAVETEVSFRTA
jgi:uncharacterized OsmC-like protein